MKPKIEPIFTEADFEDVYGPYADLIADLANSIIEKRLGPRVTGCKAPVDEFMTWSERHISPDTHQAYLLDVQEIAKDCVHEPKLWHHSSGAPDSYEPTCAHCGVALKAEWREV